MQGEYSKSTPVLDLKEGYFIKDIPSHPFYLIDELSERSSQLNKINFYDDLEDFYLNRFMRRDLLEAYKQFLSLHIESFGELKSLHVLQEILG